MSPEKHDQIRKLIHPDAASALTRAAVLHGLAVEEVVDGMLGHPNYGRINPEALAKAKALLVDHATEIGKLRPAWKPKPPPDVLVMVVGATMADPDATKAIVRKHFTDADYPVRVELSHPGAYVVARHFGSSADMRDVVPPDGFLAEVEAGLVWPKPPARRVGVDELAEAMHRRFLEAGVLGPTKLFANLDEDAQGRVKHAAKEFLASFDVFERPAAS